MHGRLRIEKQPATVALEEGNTPAVRVLTGGAPALAKAGEGKADVGGDVAVHPQELAHRCLSYCIISVWCYVLCCALRIAGLILSRTHTSASGPPPEQQRARPMH